METIQNNIYSIWEEVLQQRNEYETRIARLEMKVKGQTEFSQEDLLEMKKLENLQYEELWIDLQSRISAMEGKGNSRMSSARSVMFLDDTFDTEWLKDSILEQVRRLRGQEEHVEKTEEAKKQPVDSKLSDSEQPGKDGSLLQHARESLRYSNSEEHVVVKTLNVSLQAMKVDTDDNVTCLVDVDGYKRSLVGARTGRKSGIGHLSVSFQKFSNESSIRIFLYANGVCLGESAEAIMRDFVSDRDRVVAVGAGEVVIRVEISQEDVAEEAAKRHVSVAANAVTDRRGGAHASVPRFVKKLKSLKQLKQNHLQMRELHGEAKSVEDECVKPLPNLDWLEEQVLKGWNGEVQRNAKGQTLLHLLALTASPSACEQLLKQQGKWDCHLKDKGMLSSSSFWFFNNLL